MYFCRAYTRGLCARCVPRSVDRDGQARPQHDHETKPNHLHLGHIRTAVACTYPERTHLLTTPGTSIRDGPRRRAGGGSFAGTRERHYRSAITRPGARARERRGQTRRRRVRGGGGEREVERTTNRGQANYDTHTQRPILPIFGLESAPYYLANFVARFPSSDWPDASRLRSSASTWPRSTSAHTAQCAALRSCKDRASAFYRALLNMFIYHRRGGLPPSRLCADPPCGLTSGNISRLG